MSTHSTIRTGLLTGIAALLLAATQAAQVLAASPSRTFVSGWQPVENVEGINNCNGEHVSATGQIHQSFQQVVGPNGNEHLLGTERLRSTGVGLTTGSKYISNEGGTFVSNTTVSGAQIFTSEFVGTFLAIDKNVPDLHYRFTLRTTIDALGQVRVFVERFEIFCR